MAYSDKDKQRTRRITKRFMAKHGMKPSIPGEVLTGEESLERLAQCNVLGALIMNKVGAG